MKIRSVLSRVTFVCLVLALALPSFGKTWHWVGGKSTGHNYGFQWWTDAANWLENAGGTMDLPADGDTVVLDDNWKARLTINNNQPNLQG